MYVYVYILSVHACIYTRVILRLHTCKHVYVTRCVCCVCACMCVHVYVMCACMHV